MIGLIRRIVGWLFHLVPLADFEDAVRDANKYVRKLNELQREQAHTPFKIADIEHDMLSKFLPVLAERGRRVLGNLKQSSPRTVQCDSELLTDAATILSPATPGGALGRAYVVDTMLDLRCLNLALRGGDGIHWEVDDIFVCIKGVSVIVESEIYKEEANDG